MQLKVETHVLLGSVSLAILRTQSHMRSKKFTCKPDIQGHQMQNIKQADLLSRFQEGRQFLVYHKVP